MLVAEKSNKNGVFFFKNSMIFKIKTMFNLWYFYIQTMYINLTFPKIHSLVKSSYEIKFLRINNKCYTLRKIISRLLKFW